MGNAAQKVVFNTTILYGKMFVTAGITFYTTRVVLDILGDIDYGIYTLIAGVIAMLSFLNAAMTVSTQRYLSYHQGTNNLLMQKKVFSNSWILHIVIGLIIVLLLEIICPFLFDSVLNIPSQRLDVAKIIYHMMVISVFFTIISVPFTASLNAHENMLWIAVVNIIEVLLKLGVAVSLIFISDSDKLVIFGVLTAFISLISFLIYSFYCLKKYDECDIRHYCYDKPLMKELTGYAGWNLFGVLCGMGRNQGLAVLLNLFFGTVINAAYGIANQLAGQINFFSATMLRAINPQIMKSEGQNDRKRMLKLSMSACKYGFFLLAILAIPAIFEMPAILGIWLKKVPDHTVAFCSLMLIGTLVKQWTIGLQSAAQATGKIRVYQAVVGSLLLLNLPIAYILLKLDYPPYFVLISFICVESIACFFRIFFLEKLAGLSIKEFVAKVFLKTMLPAFSSLVVCFFITEYVHWDFRFLLTFSLSCFIFIITIYIAGLEDEEKIALNGLLKKLRSILNINRE
ncbi:MULTISPECIES: lipopolysaccharide biosynthesis protein [Dysgonomonas]|uniref:Polysaccharide biosynthesis protein C-terminal domain-containing protein n=1 Tax=Dysgonomonas gadei ATCC BAA-286 TaxID=742766 RepID=F5IUQ7_9BACT|nr:MULTISPECIES: MATE family efflux transporter [Dysgonomonas]EGK02957.1 hypothetical protein HMPREF9455_01207 [Dysgonomonas gadei ATCC BAA-286]